MVNKLVMGTPILSIIVPYYDVEERRTSLLRFAQYTQEILESISDVQIVLVTNYSRCQDVFETTTNNLKIVTVDDEDTIFSLSKYRNLGVTSAQSEWVLLMDIDLYISVDKLNKLKQYLSLLIIENSFVVFPTVYFNEGSIGSGNSFDFNYFSSNEVYTYAASSSTIALRKHYYLELGGQNEKFKGWGFEDWEFANRLIANYDFFPPSKNMSYFDPDGYEHINSFTGLKGMLRLYADLTRASGFYFFHHWHQKTSSFRKENLLNINKEIFQNAGAVYKKEGHQLPLLNPDEGYRVVIYRKSPIAYNRQLLAGFKVIDVIDNIEEYSSLEQESIDLLISGVVLDQDDYQYFVSKGIKIVEPYFFGASRHMNWLLNRELPSKDRKQLSSDNSKQQDINLEILDSQAVEKNCSEYDKPICIIVFNPSNENEDYLLQQRSLLFSLAFLHFENYCFIWFEQRDHKNLNNKLVFIKNIKELQDKMPQASVVIHLNTALLMDSLKFGKPTVVVNNHLDCFKNIHINTLDGLDQFIINPKVLDSSIYKCIVNSSSEYSLYNTQHEKYDSVYLIDDYPYQVRYFNVFLEEYSNKQYSWSEVATANRKISSQYFHILKDSDFQRTYDWGNHDLDMEYLYNYNLIHESSNQTKLKRAEFVDPNRIYKRYKKFRQNPKRFFEDSRFSILNMIGKLYK